MRADLPSRTPPFPPRNPSFSNPRKRLFRGKMAAIQESPNRPAGAQRLPLIQYNLVL